MHKNDESKHYGRGFAISVLVGTTAGFLLVLVLFAILASAIASGKVPEDMMRNIAVAAAFLGALCGAVVAVKRHRARILAVGLCVGILMFLCTTVGILFSDAIGESMTVYFLIAFITGGIAGGLLNLKRKRHKRAY
jgi:putative membrane protein (TIGR04086 family)